MLSHIVYSLSFKMKYIVYLGQKGGGALGPPPPLNPPLKMKSDVPIVPKQAEAKRDGVR